MRELVRQITLDLNTFNALLRPTLTRY